MTEDAWITRLARKFRLAFLGTSSDMVDPHQRDQTEPRAAAPVAPSAPAVPAASVYASSLKQWSTAVTWLIGALAAVAAAIIAGSQLSSIGQLSRDTERDRLLMAAGGIVVALGLILLSIGLLFWAQSPSNTDFSRLNDLAAGTRSFGLAARVRKLVCDDASFHRGNGDLGGLLEALSETRKDYYKLRADHYLKARSVAGESHGAKRTAAEAQRKRLADELVIVDSQLDEYRNGLLRVAQLDVFLRTRRRYCVASWAVLCLSVLATLAFVSFAWAANPPANRTEAAPQRPVSATLKLTSQGVQALQDLLGTTCAATAFGAGIPVIALNSSDGGVEVVAVPTADCPDLRRVLVTIENGAVTAN